MKQSKKIICGLTVLCVVLVIVVAVLLAKVLTTRNSGGEVQTSPTPGTTEQEPLTPGAAEQEPATPGTTEQESATPGTAEQEPATPGTTAQVPSTPDTAAQTPEGNEQIPGGSIQTPVAENQDIGEDAAKTAALTHAGLSETEVTGMKMEQDWDDGRLEYEIEFWCGTTEYDYTIDACSGVVLKYEQEQHGGIQDPAAQQSAGDAQAPAVNPSNQNQDIGKEAAKTAALTHAGLSETEVIEMKVEQDWEDGRLEYEVEFKSGGMEYDYTIDGVTGTVLSFEKEIDD